ncbi:MAG: ABC transporter ATP-binding protein [Actinomycetota bacterium]|nr:ABC transporter ATP-binding protein [Actinomycetota bacterium]
MRATVQPGQIRARGLGRRFEIRLVRGRSLKAMLLGREPPGRRELWALRDVDLDVTPGEAFGIIGLNGSGKSTLLKLIAGIFAPTTGSLEVGGRVGSLIEVGAGFHPEFTGRENVYLNAAIYGIPRRYVDEHLDEIIAFAELESFADMPVKTYSSGMYMRLGFSVAMHINPDILLLDEVLAVGDEAFQQKCYGKIWDFKRAGGSIVFVSHDAGAVERICDQAMLLEKGRAVERGTAEEVLRAYHRRLALDSEPATDGHGPVDPAGPCHVHEVRAIGGDGEARDRFTEGEPVTLELWLYSDSGVEGAQVRVVVREASGYLIGAQTAPAVNLRPERLERLRLNFPGLPMREGRFFIDVAVTSHDGDEQLALAERALELSVFSADPTGDGAIRLGGSWEFPG